MNSKNENKNPVHVAVIMDGNGRWAKKKGFKRVLGHKNGVKAVRETVETAGKIGVKYLTLYAFSSENWNRPKAEVFALMNLLVDAIKKETKNLMKNNVKVLTIGDFNKLPEKVQKNLNLLIDQTSKNTGLNLVLALSYGSRDELLNAFKKIAVKIKTGELSPEDINEQKISENLYTYNIPDPDLIIRTSGEQRISNFLLWQIAYSEFYFTEVLWPDFKPEDFMLAIDNYKKRKRRFGKTDDQI